MAFSRIRESASQLWRRVRRSIPFQTSESARADQRSREPEHAGGQAQLFAYRVMGKRTNMFLPLFRDLDTSLHSSGMLTSFRFYVSLTLLATLVAIATTTLIVPPVLHFALDIPLFPSILFGVGSSLIAGVLTVVGFHLYPAYRADIVKRSLDDNMAFTAGYMVILAGAGVPSNSVFRSLSNLPQTLAIADESRIITRDVELFGADMITALENASKRTPSKTFQVFLEGLIATIHSGGNLGGYLLQRSRQGMKSKRIALRKFSDTLGMFSEVYVTMLVAGPLIFVVMLAVMAMLGGTGLGIMSPTLLLTLLTYIGIPVGSIVFLIILDLVTPKW
jgi:flagellar protein FlaJ